MHKSGVPFEDIERDLMKDEEFVREDNKQYALKGIYKQKRKIFKVIWGRMILSEGTKRYDKKHMYVII